MTNLAPREEQIIALVSDGRTNKNIAHAVGLKEGTVKQYIHALFVKLKCSNRTELAKWFWERGSRTSC